MKANEISAVGSEAGTSVGSEVGSSVGGAVGAITGNPDGSIVTITDDEILRQPTEFKMVLEKTFDRLAGELPTKIPEEADIMPIKEFRVTNAEIWCGVGSCETLSKMLPENVLRNTVDCPLDSANDRNCDVRNPAENRLTTEALESLDPENFAAFEFANPDDITLLEPINEKILTDKTLVQTPWLCPLSKPITDTLVEDVNEPETIDELIISDPVVDIMTAESTLTLPVALCPLKRSTTDTVTEGFTVAEIERTLEVDVLDTVDKSIILDPIDDVTEDNTLKLPAALCMLSKPTTDTLTDGLTVAEIEWTIEIRDPEEIRLEPVDGLTTMEPVEDIITADNALKLPRRLCPLTKSTSDTLTEWLAVEEIELNLETNDTEVTVLETIDGLIIFDPADDVMTADNRFILPAWLCWLCRPTTDTVMEGFTVVEIERTLEVDVLDTIDKSIILDPIDDVTEDNTLKLPAALCMLSKPTTDTLTDGLTVAEIEWTIEIRDPEEIRLEPVDGLTTMEPVEDIITADNALKLPRRLCPLTKSTSDTLTEWLAVEEIELNLETNDTEVTVLETIDGLIIFDPADDVMTADNRFILPAWLCWLCRPTTDTIIDGFTVKEVQYTFEISDS
jgi:hypothetical protein